MITYKWCVYAKIGFHEHASYASYILEVGRDSTFVGFVVLNTILKRHKSSKTLIESQTLERLAVNEMSEGNKVWFGGGEMSGAW